MKEKKKFWTCKFLSIIYSNIDESPFGPLTQRLVSALIEENIMTSIDDVMTDVNGGSEAPAISPKALAKQLNIGMYLKS